MGVYVLVAVSIMNTQVLDIERIFEKLVGWKGGGRSGGREKQRWRRRRGEQVAKISFHDIRKERKQERKPESKKERKGAEPSALGIDPLVVYVNVQSTQQLMINYASDSSLAIDSHSMAFNADNDPVDPAAALT